METGPLHMMDIRKLGELVHTSQIEMEKLIQLREDRRRNPDYKGCDFCLDTGIGAVGDDLAVPCPEHNGLCV